MVKYFLGVVSVLSTMLLVVSCSKESPVSVNATISNQAPIGAVTLPFTPQGAIAAASIPDGRVILAARSTANQVWTRRQDMVNGLWTSGWSSISGKIVGNITMIQDPRFSYKALTLIARNDQNRICFSTEQSLNSNAFSSWAPEQWSTIMRTNCDLAAINGGLNNENFFVFYREVAGSTLRYIKYWKNNTYGNTPEGVGSSTIIGTKIAVGKNQDGRLEVFTTNSSNNLIHIWQTDVANNTWNPSFDNLGGMIDPNSQIAVERNADDCLEVFVIKGYTNDNTAYSIWHIAQTSANGTWGTWQPMPQAWADKLISAGKNSNGTLEIFYRYNSLCECAYHNWQVTPGSSWSGAYYLTSDIVTSIPNTANIAIASYPNGKLAAFTYGFTSVNQGDGNFISGNYIWYSCQDGNSPSGWSTWTPLIN